jgi:hypothetical protein
MEIDIICPKCGNLVSLLTTTEIATYDIHCSACDSIFTSYLAKVRAKRSRGHRSRRQKASGTGTRWFSIRVKNPDKTESLIEFWSDYYSDLELRQGDDVVFSYWRNRVYLVQNLTINRFYGIVAPRLSILQQIIYILASLALIAALCLVLLFIAWLIVSI